MVHVPPPVDARTRDDAAADARARANYAGQPAGAAVPVGTQRCELEGGCLAARRRRRPTAGRHSFARTPASSCDPPPDRAVLALRTADFWRRASYIYSSYKVKQVQDAACRLAGWSEDRLRDDLWAPHHEWAGRQMYDLAVGVRGFYLKVWGGRGGRGGKSDEREGVATRRERRERARAVESSICPPPLLPPLRSIRLSGRPILCRPLGIRPPRHLRRTPKTARPRAADAGRQSSRRHRGRPGGGAAGRRVSVDRLGEPAGVGVGGAGAQSAAARRGVQEDGRWGVGPVPAQPGAALDAVRDGGGWVGGWEGGAVDRWLRRPRASVGRPLAPAAAAARGPSTCGRPPRRPRAGPDLWPPAAAAAHRRSHRPPVHAHPTTHPSTPTPPPPLLPALATPAAPPPPAWKSCNRRLLPPTPPPPPPRSRPPPRAPPPPRPTAWSRSRCSTPARPPSWRTTSRTCARGHGFCPRRRSRSTSCLRSTNSMDRCGGERAGGGGWGGMVGLLRQPVLFFSLSRSRSSLTLSARRASWTPSHPTWSTCAARSR